MCVFAFVCEKVSVCARVGSVRSNVGALKDGECVLFSTSVVGICATLLYENKCFARSFEDDALDFSNGAAGFHIPTRSRIAATSIASTSMAACCLPKTTDPPFFTPCHGSLRVYLHGFWL